MMQNTKTISLILIILFIACQSINQAFQGGGGEPTKKAPQPRSTRPKPAKSNKPSDTKDTPNPIILADLIPGDLAIKSEPPLCSVMVNGKAQGSTNDDGFLNLDLLKPGQYLISIRKEGFIAAEQTIEVSAGRSVVLNVQLSPNKPEIISGGNLNDQAVSKPEPIYPAAARGSQISKTVTLQIVVDESGKVESASVVDGNALLHQSALSAAYQARFNPVLDGGRVVKVSGTISYDFKQPNSFQSFRSPSGRFTLDYPLDWKYTIDNDSSVVLTPTAEADPKHAVVVVYFSDGSSSDKRPNFDHLIQSIVQQMSQISGLHEQTGTRHMIKLAGEDALTTSLVSSGANNQKAKLIIRSINGGMFLLMHIAPSDEFDQYEPILEAMTQSLKVNQPSSGVHITHIGMAKDNGSGKPGVTTTSFSPYERALWCSIKLSEYQAGTKVQFFWYALGVGGLTNYPFANWEHTTKVLESDAFNYYTIGGRIWPVGKYRVDVSINGRPDKSIEFRIQ